MSTSFGNDLGHNTVLFNRKLYFRPLLRRNIVVFSSPRFSRFQTLVKTYAVVSLTVALPIFTFMGPAAGIFATAYSGVLGGVGVSILHMNRLALPLVFVSVLYI